MIDMRSGYVPKCAYDPGGGSRIRVLCPRGTIPEHAPGQPLDYVKSVRTPVPDFPARVGVPAI